jgi:hypothetical protein
MKRVALLIMVPLVAGCDVRTKNPANDEGKVTINANESGEVNFNLPFVSGNVKLPEGVMENGDFDIDGVKMIPGGKMTGFNVNAGDKTTINLAFTAPASPDEVRAYFLEQFEKKGVEAAAAGDAVTGKTKDGDSFVINVEPAAQGSQGRIAIQDKD